VLYYSSYKRGQKKAGPAGRLFHHPYREEKRRTVTLPYSGGGETYPGKKGMSNTTPLLFLEKKKGTDPLFTSTCGKGGKKGRGLHEKSSPTFTPGSLREKRGEGRNRLRYHRHLHRARKEATRPRSPAQKGKGGRRALCTGDVRSEKGGGEITGSSIGKTSPLPSRP